MNRPILCDKKVFQFGDAIAIVAADTAAHSQAAVDKVKVKLEFVWNLDIEPLKNCCIHVVSPEGKLIPFCAYNLTDKFGHSIYRRER